jgi:hypothetical protein
MGGGGRSTAVALAGHQQLGGRQAVRRWFGSMLAVAAVQRQHVGSIATVAGSVAVMSAAWRWWGWGSGITVAVVAAAAGLCRQPAWGLQHQFGGIAMSAAAAEQWEPHCCRAPPWWRQRNDGGGTDINHQSTESGGGNGNGNSNNNDT